MSKVKEEKVQCQELLPGIPDDITVDLITTKLPWSAVWKLRILSRGWQQVIQSRKVYNARVRSNSTETLIFTDLRSGMITVPIQKQNLAIYSLRDKCIHYPPSIPNDPEGILLGSQLVSLDGKLYVLGGRIQKADGGYLRSEKVYVLDLVVGQRQWKEVASMHASRVHFASDVADGKIYVCGGRSMYEDTRAPTLEVYDPKVNAWKIVPVYDPGSIMPVVSSDISHQLLAAKKGLCVVQLLTAQEGLCVFSASPACGSWLSIYHPGRNDWRPVGPFNKEIYEKLFVAKGKLHSISGCSVKVYNMAKKCWTLLHSFSFEEEYGGVESVVAVNNELLVKSYKQRLEMQIEMCFLQSRGFGSENERITWDEVCNTFDCSPFAPMIPVQL